MFPQLPGANVGLLLFSPDATPRNKETQQTKEDGKEEVPSSCVVFVKYETR